MHTSEVELRFMVPAAARRAVAAEIGKASQTLERTSLTTLQLDTSDRRLTRAGLSWRLRREGRRWVQTLDAAGLPRATTTVQEAIRPNATPDAAVHGGTSAGQLLARTLEHAIEDGTPLGVRFKVQVRRISRRVRVRGAVVEVAFDDGKLIAGDRGLALSELEFRLVSGANQAMLALAERWRKRFGVVYEPRTRVQRGDALADGDRFAPVRRACRPTYADTANAKQAFAGILAECLAQINENAAGLFDGDPERRTDHVHQLRIGVRRLRSALQSFKGWAPAPPSELVEGLKTLFAELGRTRDEDVLAGGVAAALAQVGAPRLEMPARAQGVDASGTVRSGQTQRILLAWLAWRAWLSEPHSPASGAALPMPSGTGEVQAPSHEVLTVPPEDTARGFHRSARKRLGRWHRRLAADSVAFDQLDEPALHALRKRIKRQRYAVEFFAPVLRRKEVKRYLEPLAVVQDRMGLLNDLFVARGRYEALVDTDARAWFALGWITARIAEVRAQAKVDMDSLARTKAPSR